MENCPDCGAHRSGGWTQRTREVIELPVVGGASHRARLPCSDLPGLPTALHTSGGTGRRGPGPAAPRRQPAQPDRHAAGRGAAPIRSVQWYLDTVHQLRLSVGAIVSATPSHGAAGPTSGGRDPGPHPRQPSGPRRRNRLARGRGQWLRLDFQHPHRTLLPAATDVGARRWWTKRWASRSPECWSAISTLPNHHYDGPKQRCWAHLLRDIHDQRTRYPKDAALARWAAAVHQLYVAAVEAGQSHHEPWQRRYVAQLAWERKLPGHLPPFSSA